jgi:hypothetical protein
MVSFVSMMDSSAGTGFEAARAREHSNLYFPADDASAPALSLLAPSEARQQNEKNTERASKSLQRDFSAWRPRNPVQGPYDPTTRLCTAHISPYSEVPDDSAFLTEVVEEETDKNLKPDIQLDTGAQQQQVDEHQGIHCVKYTTDAPTSPQKRPISASQALPQALPRVFVPRDPEAAYCSIGGLECAPGWMHESQCYRVQPAAPPPAIVPPPVPPQIKSNQKPQSYQPCAAQLVSALHATVLTATETPKHAPYPKPLYPVPGTVMIGGGYKAEKVEASDHVVYIGAPLPQNTRHRKLRDTILIVFFSVMLVLMCLGLVLLLSGAFS